MKRLFARLCVFASCLGLRPHLEGSADLTRQGLRWTVSGLIALTAFAAQTAPAFALQHHKLQPGETLSAVARHYHVSIKDIARANHLSSVDSVRYGANLTIPNPPKKTIVPATMRRRAAIEGDRVSVRMRPEPSARRVGMFDKGVAVTVTAQRDGWSQVTTPDGIGWVRSDLLRGGHHTVASIPSEPERSPLPVKRHKHYAPALAADTRRRRVLRAAKGRHAETLARAAEKMRAHRKSAVVALREKRRHEKTHLASLRRKHNWKVAQTHGKSQWRLALSTHHSYRHKRYTPEAERPAASSDIVRTAYAYRGTPYVYGGSGRSGFDCSGFTSYLYRQKGVSLPHSARAQFRSGHRVSQKELKSGDLVFFHTVTPGISHVGMYVGGGKFVHASSRRSGGVRVDSLNSGYYSKAYRGATRVKK